MKYVIEAIFLVIAVWLLIPTIANTIAWYLAATAFWPAVGWVLVSMVLTEVLFAMGGLLWKLRTS